MSSTSAASSFGILSRAEATAAPAKRKAAVKEGRASESVRGLTSRGASLERGLHIYARLCVKDSTEIMVALSST